ncbi:MAG: hypothetical protein ACREEB_09240 [Caulobacteraceae bacterium]
MDGNVRATPADDRFAALPRPAAIAILAALLISTALGLWSPTSVARRAPKGVPTDVFLYRAVVQRVRAGEPYEEAAVTEQRARHYPLKPFVVVRPPTLAVLLSLAPNQGVVNVIEACLGALVIYAWTVRLHGLGPGPPWMIWTAACLFTGVGVAMAGGVASQFTEVWAGLLIALSLGLRSERRFAAAVALGLLAALIRELAMPYLLVMALFALMERRRLEAIAFAGALAVVGAALAWHAHQVMALVRPGDLPSQGWASLGGLAFLRATVSWNLIVPLVGSWAAAVIAPLAFLGAGWWRSPTGARLFTLLAGYLAAFLVLGRPENQYWGFIVAPLVAIGFSLAPLALASLAKRVARRTA